MYSKNLIKTVGLWLGNYVRVKNFEDLKGFGDYILVEDKVVLEESDVKGLFTMGL